MLDMSTAVLEAAMTSPDVKSPARPVVELYHPLYGIVEVPSITTLNEFRRWRHSGVLNDKLNVHYFQGTILVETETEELNSHNLVKGALTACLFPLIQDLDIGVFVGDNMLLTNDEAELSTEPDGMVILRESFLNGRVALTAGEKTGAVATEIVGSPDLVIEIISPSSVRKDLKTMMQSYYRAGIQEYWVIDARKDPIAFTIQARGALQYEGIPAQDEWCRSPVLNKEFKIIRRSKEWFDNYRLLHR